MDQRYRHYQFGEYDETIVRLRNSGDFDAARVLLRCSIRWEIINSWEDEDGVTEIIHGFIDVPDPLYRKIQQETPDLFGRLIDALYDLSTDDGRIESVSVVRGWADVRSAPVKKLTEEQVKSRDVLEQEARTLLRSGRETPTLEFKETFAGGLAQAKDVDVLKEASWTAICAFLNAAGGDLLIGVDDRANVAGLDGDLARAGSLDALVRKVESAFGTKLKPNPIGLAEINPVEIDGKWVLHIRMKGDPSRYYELDGKIYVRRNAASKPALSAGEAAEWWSKRQQGLV